MIVFLVASAATIFGVHSTIKDYISNPTTTSIYIRNVNELDFPAVTVCNLNRVHCGRLYDQIIDCSGNVSKLIKLRC